MALTQDALNKLKANFSNNSVERVGRIILNDFVAKYAGKRAEFDEFVNGDRVPFTLFWTSRNVAEFTDKLNSNRNIDKRMAKAFMDKLFKYSNNGEQLIYANRRSPLPEIVTFDDTSLYSITVDLMHSKGTGDDGKPFENYYVKVQNVTPTQDRQRNYITCSEEELHLIKNGMDVTANGEVIDSDGHTKGNLLEDSNKDFGKENDDLPQNKIKEDK